jgi:hypothetical protein
MPREQAARAQDQDDQEHDMPRQRLPFGRDLRPVVCATPRITPPASVPQKLPKPPMITASKAKIRREGPISGSKVARAPR